MCYLGFDIGTKRIGISYSDDSGQFAFPECIITTDSDVFKKIFELCEKYKPSAFVVGNPDSGVADVNPIAKEVKKFVSELESRFGLPVHLVNEYGTSHSAKIMNMSMLGQKHTQSMKSTIPANTHVDAQAAALLLQRFLDSGTR